MPIGGCWADFLLRLPIEGYGPRGNDDSAGKTFPLRGTQPPSKPIPRYSYAVLARISQALSECLRMAVHLKQGRPRFGAWYRIGSAFKGVVLFACGVKYSSNI